jgi:hypothetical protein
MSERYDGPRDNEPEISKEQKQALIQRVREFAPFTGQRVDIFGAYETRFLYGTAGHVTIHIPGLSGTHVPGSIIDDMVQIIKKVPEELDNGITLVHMYSYSIYETDLSAEYKEDVRPFDTHTAEPIGPNARDDTDAFLEAQGMEDEFRVDPTFTAERLREVTELLDSLDPEDTF